LLQPIVAEAEMQARHLFNLQTDFNHPSAVRVSNEGRIYVLDGVNGRIVVFDPDGKPIDTLSSADENPLDLPMDLLLFQDEIIVADSGNHRLVVFSSDGEVVKTIALPQGDQAVKPTPTGLAVIDETVYWSDRANSRVCSTSLTNGKQQSCWGGFGSQEGEFRYPFMMSIDRDQYLYVVDVLNGRVQVFNERGRSFGAVVRFGVTNDSLLRPNGIDLSANDQMLVSDAYTGRILLFHGRSFAGLLKDEKGNALIFNQPVGITRWQDRLYVVEMEEHRVQVLQLHESEGDLQAEQRGAHFSKPTRQDCVTCHLSWSEDYQKARHDEPIPPVGSRKMCMSCHHGAVIDSRTSLGQGAQHPDYYHPQKSTKFENIGNRKDDLPAHYPYAEMSIPYCGTCHTPHRFSEAATGLTQHAENLWMRDTDRDSEFCRQCHESLFAEGEEAARKNGIHPVSIDLEEPVEINGEKLSRVNCASCHKVHGGEKESALLVVSDERISELCAACHTRHHAETLQEAKEKGIHPVNIDLDEPVVINDKEISRLDCLSCHSVHAGHQQTAGLVEEHANGALCESCHEQAMGVIDTDHDMRVSAPDSENQLEETPRQAGVCGSCHSMHRNRYKTPMLSIASHAADDVKQSHLERDRLCQNCHHDEGIGKKRVVSEYTHPYRDLVMHSKAELMPLLDEHEEVVESGQIACITCHDPHVWSPRDSEKRRKSSESDSGDTDQDGTALNSFLRQKHTRDGFCVVCHGLETPLKYKYYHDQRSRPDRAEYLR
jgi:predicted CXXCH cytochrome family protein